MIEPTGAASSATRAATTGGTPVGRMPAPDGAKSFAGELARFASAPASSAKAAPRPDGEQTRKIAGHPYSRIENGSDKGLFVNQVAGSPREGLAFRKVERDERVFHVYGSGKDKTVVEITSQSRSDPAPAQPTGGAMPSMT